MQLPGVEALPALQAPGRYSQSAGGDPDAVHAFGREQAGIVGCAGYSRQRTGCAPTAALSATPPHRNPVCAGGVFTMHWKWRTQWDKSGSNRLARTVMKALPGGVVTTLPIRR